MDNYISKNLRRFRKERGMTQDELAKKLGVSFQSVSKWEQGTMFISSDINMP